MKVPIFGQQLATVRKLIHHISKKNYKSRVYKKISDFFTFCWTCSAEMLLATRHNVQHE